MNVTIGKRIAEKRRAAGLKQDEVAERLGVSPQAVSKWENDISAPDISLLPALASLLGCTVDALLTGESTPAVKLLPSEERKSSDEMMLRILVNSADGGKVKVNLPISLVKMGITMGMTAQLSNSDALNKINMDEILKLVDQGLVGKLVEVENSDGSTVEIWVEAC